MNLKTRLAAAVVALVSAGVIAACGPQTSTPSGLEISAKGEELAYDKAALEATAGQQTTLTFKNTSAGQSHNWLLVNGGDDVAQAVSDAAATTADYLPADKASVIASTKMLPGGQSESITFTAPAGTYTFLCTYPGHYGAGMKGSLTVK